MKVYIVEFEDFTIGNNGGILGVYDNFEDAQKRADEFSKRFIRSDEKGPLGKAEVFVCDMNQPVVCCAAEAYSQEEIENG